MEAPTALLKRSRDPGPAPVRRQWHAGSIIRPMQQPIAGYRTDEQRHWVAELACGHLQHVRHNPPWVERPWVITPAGRESMLGFRLDCKKCDRGEPADTSD